MQAKGLESPKASQQPFVASTSKRRVCTLLSEKHVRRMAATYTVDSERRRLVVTMVSDFGAAEIVCPTADIEDIYTIDDGADCFEQAVMAAISPDEHDRLLLIVCRSTSSGEQRCVNLLEESAHGRDRLLDLMQSMSRWQKEA